MKYPAIHASTVARKEAVWRAIYAEGWGWTDAMHDLDTAVAWCSRFKEPYIAFDGTSFYFRDLISLDNHVLTNSPRHLVEYSHQFKPLRRA